MLWTQSQREALFDLITLATYADAHLSLKEEALMESVLLTEGWESPYPKALFLDRSRARARDVIENEASMASYVKGRVQCFDTLHSQNVVMDTIRNVIARDGLVTEEHVFLVRLNDAFPKVKP